MDAAGPSGRARSTPQLSHLLLLLLLTAAVDISPSSLFCCVSQSFASVSRRTSSANCSLLSRSKRIVSSMSSSLAFLRSRDDCAATRFFSFL